MSWRPLPDPEWRPPVPVQDDLDALLRRLGGAGLATAGVFTRWEEIVGASVATHAQPTAVRGTTLVVTADAPAYATQLRLLTPQLLARVAELTGPGVVEAVEVRVRA